MVSEGKVQIYFFRDFLVKLLGHLVCDRNAPSELILNCERLFVRVDASAYQDDDEMEFLYKAVCVTARALRIVRSEKAAIVDQKIWSALEVVILSIGIDKERAESIIDEACASVDEASIEADSAYLTREIGLKWSYLSVYEGVPRLEHLAAKLRANDYDDLSEFIGRVRDECQRIVVDARFVGGADAMQKDFSTRPGDIDEGMNRAIDELNRPGNMVRTGLRLHNRQLNGGYQVGRTYLYVGRTGGGKSNLLLQVMRWFALYNKDVAPRNEGLAPCALYVSLENDQTETAERVFDTFVPPSARDGRGLKAFGAYDGEAEDLLRQHGALDRPYLVYRYRRHMSISTADLEDMIDEFAKDGLEVRLLVLDYVKRIRPVDRTKDLRLDLGEVINELSSIAKARRIPIVSAAQMNVRGIEEIENSIINREKGDKVVLDVVKKLNTGVVGESRLMVENIDYCFLFNNEESPMDDSGVCLTMNKIKGRGRDDSGWPYFVQPYLQKGSLMLDEDEGTDALKGRRNIGDQLAKFDVDADGNISRDGARKGPVVVRRSLPDQTG